MGLDQMSSSSLDELIGYNVNLYVGDETVKGKIVGVESDHVILENENQYVFYFNFDTIQAITKNTKQFQEEKITSEFLQTTSLLNLLISLKDSWVTIVCLNKQKFNGILTSADKHFASLISGEEKILIKLSNISNVLKGYIKDENKTDEQTNEDTNANEITNQADSNIEESKHQEVKQVVHSVKEIETPVREQIEVKSEPTKEKATASNKEEKSIKVLTNEVENETKVWSKPINRVFEPLLKETSSKKDKSIVTIQTNAKESKQKVVKETKRVNPNVEMKTTQKPTTEANSVKEMKTVKKQDSVAKGSEEYQAKPIVQSAVDKKSSEVKSNDQHKKEQSFPGFRFAGEPFAMGDNERPSIFAGWPNRKNRPRF